LGSPNRFSAWMHRSVKRKFINWFNISITYVRN
jgi:hypothetical protein